jgi:hypothetical protein
MTTETEPKTADSKTDRCNHLQTVTVILPRNPDGKGHYADQRCAACGVHLRFLPKPETVARRKRIGLQIEKLLAVDRVLEPWESNFVNRLALRKDSNTAPREEDVLNDLHAKYYPADAAAEENGGSHE